MAHGTQTLEAAGPTTPVDGHAARLLPILRAAPLQTQARLGAARGSTSMGTSAAQTQPASPAVLVLPQESSVVRTAVRGDPPCDGLRRPNGESDLGSPVRETRTPGSEWGDGRKGRCPETRPYQPPARPDEADGPGAAAHFGSAGAEVDTAVAAGRCDGGGCGEASGNGDPARG